MQLLGNLPLFKIHVNCFMAQDDSPCANALSKRMLWNEGPGAILKLHYTKVLNLALD